MSLIHLSLLKHVKPYDKVTVVNSFGYLKTLQIPTSYCWMQTYVTYSYYKDKYYLLYKNIGMVLGMLNGIGKPRPFRSYYKKLGIFKHVTKTGII